MPDITPRAHDSVEIVINNGNEAPTVMVAKIMTRGADGKWEIELEADPPMRGKVDLTSYEWAHAVGRWRKTEPTPTPPLKVKFNVNHP
jgi:hypothetical protein